MLYDIVMMYHSYTAKKKCTTKPKVCCIVHNTLHKSKGLFLPVCVCVRAREYVTAAETVNKLTAILLFQ